MSTAEVTRPPVRRRGKIFALLVLVVFVLTGVVGVGAFFMGYLDGPIERVRMVVEGEQDKLLDVAAYIDLDEMVITLPPDGGKQKFLKIRISLEIEDEETAEQIRQLIPRLMDSYQLYLRELRPRELQGSRGMFRVKEELLARTNLLVAPLHVDGVLFRDMLIQ